MSSSTVTEVAVALLAAVLLLPVSTPVRADEEDPAGWSMGTDARGRALLHYVAEAGGPRLFDFGCLRDVDNFFFFVKAVPGMTAGTGVTARLRVADAEWSITGDVVKADDGTLAFEVDRDADPRAMKKLGAGLMKVLSAPGPIVLTVGNDATVELTLEPRPPRAGIAPLLRRFDKICFGSK